MAEGVLADGSNEALADQADRQHRKVLLGEKPMPIGLGLPGMFRESLLEEEKS